MDKVEKYLQKICNALELVAAVLVLIGILLSMYGFLKDIETFSSLLGNMASFKHYLEKIFIIVIRIEFLKMLCRPNADNVIEILIFLVARHMIVEKTTPYEDFASVIGVAVLCIVHRYLHMLEKKKESAKSEEQE